MLARPRPPQKNLIINDYTHQHNFLTCERQTAMKMYTSRSFYNSILRKVFRPSVASAGCQCVDATQQVVRWRRSRPLGAKAGKAMPTIKANVVGILFEITFEIISQTLNESIVEIRRPLLAKDTKAAGLALIRFLTLSGHAFSYKVLLSVFSVQIGRCSPRQIQNSGSATSPKILLFSSLFPRPKKSEKTVPKVS